MSQISYDYKGKIALVTGGSRGIGRDCAMQLAQAGADVFFTYVSNENAAKETQTQLQALGVQAEIFQADVSDEEQVKQLITACEKRFGRIDFLISNAIGFKPELMQKVRDQSTGRSIDIPTEFFEQAFQVQAKALLVCAREGAKLMPEGGRIVALSSIGSHRVTPHYLAPGVAKAALEATMRYLAVELAKQKITVNCVSGGAVDTDALQYLTRDKDKFLQASAKRTPLARSGESVDLANIVTFLCSDAAGWICGQTIIADGGFSLVN